MIYENILKRNSNYFYFCTIMAKDQTTIIMQQFYYENQSRTNDLK